MSDLVNITAAEVTAGDFIPGLGNAYVVEVEEGNGYLSYPRTGFGQGGAMPEDTILITFHDAMGEENYLLVNPDMNLTVQR